MKHFAKHEYQKVIYINFEEKKSLQSLFADDFDISRILSAFSIESGFYPHHENTLIILDEIQEAERGVTSLKYFHELAPEFHIIAAGSYLGINIHKDNSFPVGKVEFLDLYPLNFFEFLQATEQDSLIQLLQSKDWELIRTFKNKYIDLLKLYYFVGGMPEVVAHYIEYKDFVWVRKLQEDIIQAYKFDFSKHAPLSIVPRINMIWNSIPAQLSKKNKKFIWKVLKKGARAKEFELALEWLVASGLMTKVYRITKPGLPLRAYIDSNSFKAFMVDLGLLGALSGLQAQTVLKGNSIFQEFKGALTEQFVFQQIKDKGLFYWSSERSSGEIDFIFQWQDNIVPAEVKAEENLRSKSLRFFCKKYDIKKALRFSMADYREEEWLTNIPLYAINLIK